MNAPSALPVEISIGSARLPATYEAAKTALVECVSIDECQDWADKMAALASYARQADDDSLYKLARRIQGRAVRRVGELLRLMDARGDHWENKRDGAVPSISQREAADETGLSERQRKTAVRVAKVPATKFEELVESDEPPSITKLAEMGRQSRPPPVDHLQGRDPKQFSAATHTIGAMGRFAEKCAEHDAAYVAGGVLPDEVSEARDLVLAIDAWLDRFIVNLEG